MTIAEHKLNLIRQIDELPEQSLVELEKIIMQLKANLSIQPVKKNSNYSAQIIKKKLDKVFGRKSKNAMN